MNSQLAYCFFEKLFIENGNEEAHVTALPS